MSILAGDQSGSSDVSWVLADEGAQLSDVSQGAR